MGTFAQGVEQAVQQRQQCIVARATAHFDDDDRAAFERLLAEGRNSVIRNLLGATAPGEKSLRLHRIEQCMCHGERDGGGRLRG